MGSASFICLFFAKYSSDTLNEPEKLMAIKHFCAFFEGLNIIGAIRAAVLYSLRDILFILFITLLGYTMLSSPLLRLSFVLFCGELGYGFASLAVLLIEKPIIDGGMGALILFAASKAALIAVCLRAILLSEDFSYSFSESFRKLRHPFVGKDSILFMRNSASLCGCAAIINTIYLIFLSLQNFSTL